MKKLMKTFYGKDVLVFLISLTMTESNSDGSETTGNLVINGILIDNDDDFLYLGNLKGDIMEAIKITEIARIMLNENLGDEVNYDQNWN